MKQLERDNTLIQLVINDIEFYLDQVRKLTMVLRYIPGEPQIVIYTLFWLKSKQILS